MFHGISRHECDLMVKEVRTFYHEINFTNQDFKAKPNREWSFFSRVDPLVSKQGLVPGCTLPFSVKPILIAEVIFQKI